LTNLFYKVNSKESKQNLLEAHNIVEYRKMAKNGR